MNPIKKFTNQLKEKTGFSDVLISIVVVAVAVILLMVTTVVISMFSGAIDNISGLSIEANNTIDSVQAGGYGALNLLSVVLYVLAAVAIIGAVIGIFAYVKLRG